MKNAFDMPDMDELARQMEEAMTEAQKAMEDLPAQTGELESIMGSLSGLAGGLPAQMEELSTAMAALGEQHQANVESMAGEPDWLMKANIEVGNRLHVIVRAGFDLGQVTEAWSTTQSAEFESVVAGVVTEAAGDMDDEVVEQIMGQLRKGRSMAVVACRIQGAPADAAETLQLSPEGNIPLIMDEGILGFEFAPMLTIQNRWERAEIPTFVPMGDEIVVPLSRFERGETFRMEFTPSGQEEEMRVELRFEPVG
jgi:hypothetical protein